jgi:hypothetical protein
MTYQDSARKQCFARVFASNDHPDSRASFASHNHARNAKPKVMYTIQSVYNNSRGGKDVTQAVVNSLRVQAAPAQVASPIPPKS